MENKSSSLKLTIKILTFQLNFVSEVCLSNRFSATEPRGESLNGNIFDFSIDYNSIDKSDLLNTHKY